MNVFLCIEIKLPYSHNELYIALVLFLSTNIYQQLRMCVIYMQSTDNYLEQVMNVYVCMYACEGLERGNQIAHVFI